MSANHHQPKQEGSIRLIGQSGPHEGWVEIYLLGHWGTVCHNGWDLLDATVVCRQMGYSRALSTPDFGDHLNASGIVWFDKVNCNGSEESLIQCSSASLGQPDCNPYSAAGVSCSSELSMFIPTLCIQFI